MEGYGKWVWESAQSLAGDQDKQMTTGPRAARQSGAGLLPPHREPGPGDPRDPIGLTRALGGRGVAAEVPARQHADTINQQLAKWGT